MKRMKIILYALCAIFSLTNTIALAQSSNVEVIKFPLTENDYFLEGIKYYNANELDKAQELFQKAIKIDDTNDAAHYYCGLIYHALNKLDLAEKHLRKAVKLDNNNYWYRAILAGFYGETDRVDIALSLFQELLEDFPKKTSLYYQIIDLYTSDNQIGKALETLNRIEKVRGINEATLNAKYELLSRNNQKAAADSLLLEIAKEYPSARTYYIIGENYKAKYQDTLAIENFEKSIALNEDFTPSYYGLAEVYRYRRQFDKFFKNINVFIKDKDMMPETKISYLQQAIFIPEFVQIFKPQVDTIVNNLYTAHPKDSSAIYTAGTYFIQSGDIEKGKELYKLNINLYPNSYQLNLEYLSLLFYQGDWNNMIPYTLMSLSRFPNDLGLLEILAVAYWRNDNLNEAVKAYELIVKNAKDNNKVLVNSYTSLGDLHQSLGNKRKAFSYYKKALRLEPNHIATLNNYAYYLSSENKDLKKAFKMSRKTVLAEPDNPTYLDTYAWILYLLGEYEEAEKNFKHAMLYGGRDSGVILDHYAETLFALKKYDLAFIYWEQAQQKDSTLNLNDKIQQRKTEIKK